jgi:subtilisin family serine protease
VGAASPTAGRSEPARPPSDRPIPPDEAGARARQASSATDVRTKSGDIPLVTVEERDGKPEVTSTPVSSPDEAASVAEQKAADGDLIAVDIDKPVRASADPNDQLFGQQWAFTKVPFVDAWAADGTQGGGITVAVIDTGVMANHDDLSGQVLSGAHFLHSDSGEPVAPGLGADDFSGHGTHVAGTIAAKSNNTTGISGAAPGVKVLPVKVLCADGGGFSSDVADGIGWAVDNGADVINVSLGGGPSAAEEAEVAYARDNGVVVVAAAGNDGNGGPASYPAAYSSSQYPNVIAVAATDNANGHPAYGTTGSYLDISAPGGVPVDGCTSNPSVEVLATWNDGGYCSIAGSSMATPHVSAAAALLRAAGGCAAAQVRSRLKATATDLGIPGEDSTFGAGIVNPLGAGASCT